MRAETTIKEALERDGYALLRGVFSAEEIAGMRDEATALLATESRTVNGGLVHGPAPRDSALARRLLDDGRLAFPCSDEFPCEVHIHANTYNYWHVDLPAPDCPVDGAPPWMYKTVIYLQDHPDRDGISIAASSHREGNRPRAPSHVSTRAGDIVIFDLRVRHAGQLPNWVLGEFAWLQHRLGLVGKRGYHVFRLQRLLRPAPATPRLALFLLFARHKEIGPKYAAWRASLTRCGGGFARAT